MMQMILVIPGDPMLHHTGILSPRRLIRAMVSDSRPSCLYRPGVAENAWRDRRSGFKRLVGIDCMSIWMACVAILSVVTTPSMA